MPDLSERIQVGLLNVLEERDIQIRGYKVRLPLDVMLVASANPEDYTNRGRIITPLKDRFGSQIRTHYPLDVDTEVAIMRQESRSLDVGDVATSVPDFMDEIIAEMSQSARQHNNVNQRSGVSVRLTVSNREVMVASAMRRSLRTGEAPVVPRISDLDALVASSSGKIEFEGIDDHREGAVFEQILAAAVLAVFKRRVTSPATREIVTAFEEGLTAATGHDVASSDLAERAATIPAFGVVVELLVGTAASAPERASAVEFVLEGLHLAKRLNKDVSGAAGGVYRSRAAR